MFRCTLTDRNGTSDITDDVRNWDDIEATYKRDGYGGVVRSFTSKFEFAGDARKRLLSLFDDDYLSSSAKISLAVRDENMEYREKFSCDMDFTTMEDDGVTLSMNAVDNDVAAIIKAKKGADYEYSVSSIKEADKFRFDRLEMRNKISWGWTGSFEESLLPTVGGEEDDYTTLMSVPFGTHNPPLYVLDSEIATRNTVEVNDLMFKSFSTGEEPDSPAMLRCVAENGLDIELVADFSNLHAKPTGGESLQTSNYNIYLRDAEGNVETVGWFGVQSFWPRSFRIRMEKGDELYVIMSMSVYSTVFYAYSGDATPSISVSFIGRELPVDIDVVKPVTLLNRLLKSMNGGNDGITGEIEPSERFGKAVLCAAESIRGIPQAKMYSSFTKFCEWMEAVFGYVYAIDGKTVRFMHRESCFENAVYKHVYEYSDYKLSVDEGLVFSHVNVGYDKQDYDSVNGRDEFNFTNQYTTGMLNTENSLDLISPYRADSFGIEFLAEKRGEDTTDSESDNDLFFAGVRLSGGKYLLDRTEAVEGVNSPSTIFNAMFSPSSMAEANRSYIGACTDKLSFASSDGNSEVTIGGRKENRDIATEGAIFSVKSVSFETPDTELPESLNGLVTLHHAGKDVTGFISDVDFRYTKRKAAEYTIMVKE